MLGLSIALTSFAPQDDESEREYRSLRYLINRVDEIDTASQDLVASAHARSCSVFDPGEDELSVWQKLQCDTNTDGAIFAITLHIFKIPWNITLNDRVINVSPGQARLEQQLVWAPKSSENTMRMVSTATWDTPDSVYEWIVAGIDVHDAGSVYTVTTENDIATVELNVLSRSEHIQPLFVQQCGDASCSNATWVRTSSVDIRTSGGSTGAKTYEPLLPSGYQLTLAWQGAEQVMVSNTFITMGSGQFELNDTGVIVLAVTLSVLALLLIAVVICCCFWCICCPVAARRIRKQQIEKQQAANLRPNDTEAIVDDSAIEMGAAPAPERVPQQHHGIIYRSDKATAESPYLYYAPSDKTSQGEPKEGADNDDSEANANSQIINPRWHQELKSQQLIDHRSVYHPH